MSRDFLTRDWRHWRTPGLPYGDGIGGPRNPRRLGMMSGWARERDDKIIEPGCSPSRYCGMSKLIYIANISLDGYSEDSHGNFDWTEPSGAHGTRQPRPSPRVRALSP